MSFGSTPVPRKPGAGPLTPAEAALRLLPHGPTFPLQALRIVIGRAAGPIQVDLDLSAHDPGPSARISRRHAELTWVEGQLTLRDLGSRNGTRVNGEPLRAAEPGQPSPARALRPGDRIALAHLELELIRAPRGGA